MMSSTAVKARATLYWMCCRRSTEPMLKVRRMLDASLRLLVNSVRPRNREQEGTLL